MRALILGVTGMLGHRLWLAFQRRFETWGTLRGDYAGMTHRELFDPARLAERVRADEIGTVERALLEVRPDVVINCIGALKQRASGRDPVASISLNALFPHLLANLCQRGCIRLIHISTDCVFSGRKGMYRETDPADAEDLYGRTKLLGELSGPGCLTLRTSFIGRELGTAHGLLEWFLSNSGGRVPGYRRGVFSGFTTQAFAEILCEVVDRHREIAGLYHVSSEPISKFELLHMVRRALNVDIEIEPDDSVQYDRSLDGTRFRQTVGMNLPSWSDMMADLMNEPADYYRSRQG
ncbi:MAG: SDR family oxidoreductase [Acidobacteriota bacterium]